MKIDALIMVASVALGAIVGTYWRTEFSLPLILASSFLISCAAFLIGALMFKIILRRHDPELVSWDIDALVNTMVRHKSNGAVVVACVTMIALALVSVVPLLFSFGYFISAYFSRLSY